MGGAAMIASDWLVLLEQAAIGFVISVGIGAVLLKLVPKFQFRQIAYEDAPETHQKKTGTPTLGGLTFLGAIAPLWFWADPLQKDLLFLAFACGAVGLLDDVLAIKRGKNLGLRARTKYLATALIAIMFLRMISGDDSRISMGDWAFPPDTLFHAGTFAITVPHWLWLILGILAITGTIHAVNLTDGLDGLAAGTAIPPMIVLWIIALDMHVTRGDQWPTVVTFAIGGLLGFLFYNRHPAKMFMGDTGSLALGGLLSGIAILEGEMLLLIVIGGVFVAEALSVILQVWYFKATGGKRIFRMSPLHHHFELGGLPETAVTVRFWAASLVLSLLGWVLVR